MRAVTVAAAGAAMIGSVSAASHVKHMHAKLHANVARDWVDWNATSTTTTSVSQLKTTTTTTPAAASTTSAGNWEDWKTSPEPTSTSSSTTTTPAAGETWVDWKTPSTPVEETTTTAKQQTSSVPAGSTETVTWGDWTNTETEPAGATDTEVWGDWEVTSTVTVTLPSQTPTETVTKPGESASETWGDWTSETTTVTLESTVTTTKHVQPVTASGTWGDWTSSAPVTDTLTSTKPAAPATSPAGPAWTPESDSCAISVFVSYGAPTWYPTPVANASSTAPAAQTWIDWTSTETSTTPVAVASTSTTPVTWADWTTTTTTPGSVVETTSTETWVDWTSGTITTTTPESATETTLTQTWGDWTATTTTTTTPASATETTATETSTETWGDWPSASTETATATVTSEGSSWGWSKPSGSASASASSSGSHAKPSGGSHGGSPGITANGNSWAMTYSPYTSSGGCKDATTVSADLEIISQKGFASVRVYSTDCNSLENIGTAAREHGLKLILGVWISSSGISGAKGQIEDIISWGQFDLVELIVVGNEAVFNGYCSASELAEFVSSCASSFKSAGYTGLITLTEPLSIWEDTSASSAFCEVVDVVGANLYAFFNADVSADKAGSFIQEEINILNGICSGKSVYVLETGWPSAGSCNGAACPGVENQAIALKGIHNTVGAQVVFLSYENEPWKEPGQFGVEQYWGCASVF
ncbi:putative beta-glucosidase btgE [Exophiala dermatitidis]